VTMKMLIGYKVIEIWWLSGIENFVREMILYSIRSETLASEDISEWECVGIFKPGQQFEQEHFGCVGDDLFDILEDRSAESYSSQAWSVRWRWQLFWRYGYSEEHGCDGSRI